MRRSTGNFIDHSLYENFARNTSNQERKQTTGRYKVQLKAANPVFTNLKRRPGANQSFDKIKEADMKLKK